MWQYPQLIIQERHGSVKQVERFWRRYLLGCGEAFGSSRYMCYIGASKTLSPIDAVMVRRVARGGGPYGRGPGAHLVVARGITSESVRGLERAVAKPRCFILKWAHGPQRDGELERARPREVELTRIGMDPRSSAPWETASPDKPLSAKPLGEYFAKRRGNERW